MWHFLALSLTSAGCVCASTRTTHACFFSVASVSLISFWPFSYFFVYLRGRSSALSISCLDQRCPACAAPR